MRKGFTLLEMIVVVTVLSILFLLTVPNIQTVVGVVDTKGCDALLKVVDSAILQYKLSYDSYPHSTNELLNSGFLSEDQLQCSDGAQIYIIEGKSYVQ